MNDAAKGDIAKLVIAEMEARRLKGIAAYGKTVDADDASEDWLQHAFEEAMDLTIYLRAEIERRKGK